MRASGLSLLRACESGNKGSGTSVANPFEERGIFFIELEPVFARDRIKGNPRGNINRGEGEREWKWSCKSRDRSKVYFFRIRNIFSNQFEHKFFFNFFLNNSNSCKILCRFINGGENRVANLV